ncbi:MULTISPECIES: class I SAM-dependent methyltransferase [Asticcacaulis]|uniref:class I SAM-dependent methyltransferase n=1 Tax=Asticcacaulis TaxID=76890 RepID=UPI001FD91AF2|nr:MULTISPECIES: class I SAM-dependent methyltransferase [Asticcacaulis]MBP2158740.1 ubiquinone/menaquinone biosynthesis C-methylase UbiE [Asticcacaulis solisilvae]MDR6799786.1 ubiquinone/menaquinone biosynthesis C-methylase UbiE [Asticcacaulis sp. BE141]
MSIQQDARFWDRLARKYAADKIADEAGYERTLARTKTYLKPTDAVLEFGCGTGTTALRLAPFTGTMVASDISSEMIAIANEKRSAESALAGRLAFVRATLEQLDYPEGAFDVVLGFNAVHLMHDVNDCLWRVRRLVKPGGLFISKTPCLGDMSPFIRAAIPVMQLFGKAPKVSTFTARQLEATIVAAGFEIVEIARHGTKGKDTRPFIVARRPAG